MSRSPRTPPWHWFITLVAVPILAFGSALAVHVNTDSLKSFATPALVAGVVSAAIQYARRRSFRIALAVGTAAFALTFGLIFGFVLVAFLTWCSSGGCQ